MAWATTKTIIPLDRVAVHLGIDPYHFNCIETSTRRPTKACDDGWFQYDYQATGRLSRESLALALKQAERLTQDHLGYAPIPVWVMDEPIALTVHYGVEWYNYKDSRDSNAHDHDS